MKDCRCDTTVCTCKHPMCPTGRCPYPAQAVVPGLTVSGCDCATTAAPHNCRERRQAAKYGLTALRRGKS